MSFDWSEYFVLAEELGGVASSRPMAGSEARQRSAVSRAYYAAFVLARNRLRDVEGVRVPAGINPHHFVARHYAVAVDPERVRIGAGLGRLRSARNTCDYDDVVPRLSVLVRRSLNRAGDLISTLRGL